MQLIAILLFTVSVLTLLSGALVFFGASKGDRFRSAWFFLATIFATIWMVSIAIFLVADTNWPKNLNWHINWTYISAIFIDIALLGYISWREKFGKIATSIFFILGLFFTYFLAKDPGLLYHGVNLSSAGNSLSTNFGTFYFIYISFFCALVPTVILTLLRQVIRARSSRKRGGELVLLVGFAISGTTSLIFNLILPLWRWDFIWLGPLAISTTIIAFYYSILRYKALNLSSIWLKILSYIVIMASGAILYMILFSIIFAAMFRGSTPSVEVIILNFIMILIFLLLMPAINEVTSSIHALILGQKPEKTTDEKKENA